MVYIPISVYNRQIPCGGVSETRREPLQRPEALATPARASVAIRTDRSSPLRVMRTGQFER